jgi:endonuclease/exonuclease/phosphatase family metal-dependent hydrolase
MNQLPFQGKIFNDSMRDRELDEEIEMHLRLLAERYVRQGMTETEAAQAARRQFGNATLLKEVNREMRRIRVIDSLIQDLRYGVRMLLRDKGFTAVAALSLALGIGANTAIFSLLDALLLKTLPVKNSEQLVFVGGLEYKYPPQPDRALHNYTVPDPVYREMSEKNTVFSGIFTFNWVEATVNDGSLAERVSGQLVS